MADRKISELTNITGANLADGDELVVVDTSASETKAITFGEFKTALDTSTGFVRITGDTMTGDLSFGDNDKAIFGNGSDLQIYHDGSNSYVQDTAAGELILKSNGPSISFQKGDGTELFTVNTSGASTLSYSGNAKLDTTSTGVDVTGTLTSDSLTLNDGTTDVAINSSNENARLDLIASRTSSNLVSFRFKDDQDRKKLEIKQNGDISFYEDTGTTAKFFWDASAESLGIGTSSDLYAGLTILDANYTTSSLGQSGLNLRGSASANGNYSAAITFTNEYRNGHAAIAGVAENADNDVMGLAFFTHSSTGGTNPTAESMRIDSSGNVGIGTSSGTTLSTKLTALNDASIITQLSSPNNTDGGALSLGATGLTNTATQAKIQAHRKGNANTGELSFSVGTGSSVEEAMRIDSSGNLLVGKTASSVSVVGPQLNANGQVRAIADGLDPIFVNRLTSDGDIIKLAKDGTTVGSIGVSGNRLQIGTSSASAIFFDSNNNSVNPSDLDGSSDNVLDLGKSSGRWKDLYLSGGVIQTNGGQSIFGGTSTVDTLVAVSVQGDTDADAMEIKVRTNGKNAIEFRNSTNGTVGKITANASSTTYATTSDYRLKTDIQAVTNATNRLKQLNPVNFEWISDGTRVDGFLAHEVQSIVPEAITGTKDAMRDEQYEVTPAVLDQDGNVITEPVMGTRSVPDYQGIDQSKLVPLLVATIKELEARITALENA